MKDDIRSLIEFALERGEIGFTCDAWEVNSKISHQTASARVHELAKAGVIILTRDKRTTSSGRSAGVYRIDPEIESPKEGYSKFLIWKERKSERVGCSPGPDWSCAAMHDPSGRRGIWYKVERKEGRTEISIAGGRDAKEYQSTIIVPSEEAEKIINILEVSRWMIDDHGTRAGANVDFQYVEPREWPESNPPTCAHRVFSKEKAE